MKNKQLTSEQRNQIEVLLQTKTPIKKVAQLLDTDKSSIYREINRNKRKRGCYSANFAQKLVAERKERFGFPRRFTAEVQKFVVKKLAKEQWSPEQIVGFAELKNLPMVSTSGYISSSGKINKTEEGSGPTPGIS